MCFCSIYILLQVSDSPTFNTHFSENHPWRAALFLETWKTQVSGEEPHQGVHVQAAMVDPVANLITKDIPTPWRKSWEMGETWGWMSQEAWRCIVDICFFSDSTYCANLFVYISKWFQTWTSTWTFWMMGDRWICINMYPPFVDLLPRHINQISTEKHHVSPASKFMSCRIWWLRIFEI